MKTNQLKLDIQGSKDKAKYYTAFSYLNIRPLFKAKLLEYFDFDIQRAWLCDENDLKAFCEIEEITIPKSFLSQKAKLDVDECFKKAFLDEEVKLLTIEDEKYPPLLKEIPDYPISLYYKGDLNNISYDYNLAVVGSRNATTNAKLSLNKILSEFKNANITIVSGLAYGIDAQAHKSAIENNIKTIGVIGCGLDIIYPSQNKFLYEQIKQGAGVIFSEYPLKTRPMAQNFPQRNRIVVGMSKGTLVAEAQMKSGAMISANLTLDYNRELMCMPGNLMNPNTEGIYHLIKQGAGIVVQAQDVLAQLNWEIITPKAQDEYKTDLNETQKTVLDIISLEAKSFDEIINFANMEVSQLMISLTELEIKGLIIQQNNKYYKCI